MFVPPYYLSASIARPYDELHTTFVQWPSFAATVGAARRAIGAALWKLGWILNIAIHSRSRSVIQLHHIFLLSKAEGLRGRRK